MYKNLLLIIVPFLLFSSCKQQNVKSDNRISIIFETDMGNDIDDGLALDILYKYLDQDKINLLGISVNKENEYSSKFIDIMNTWYGYSEIPVAIVQNGIEDTIPVNYAKKACLHTTSDGIKFKRSLPDDYEFPESTHFYREMLTRQEDSSVTIISVGYLTNLARLLDTQADSISSLTGKELIAQKVKALSLMAGNFNGVNPHEYNVLKDTESARRVFNEWPTEIVVSPFEVGNAIHFPGSVIEQDLNYVENHPLKVAYESYLPMPYDRPMWDLTSVLYVVEQDKVQDYFQSSGKGLISVDSLGATSFESKEDGKHLYLKVDSIQSELIKKRFVELIKQKPSTFKEKNK